jgi:hypothetical protein
MLRVTVASSVLRQLVAQVLGIDRKQLADELAELKRGLRDALETAQAARSEVKQQRIDFELLYDKAAAAVARLNTRAKRAAQASEEPQPATPSGAAPDELAQAIKDGRVSLLNRRRA